MKHGWSTKQQVSLYAGIHPTVSERSTMYAHVFDLWTVERAARREVLSGLCQVNR